MLAVIGGSGVYGLEGLKNTRWVEFESPFGKPSDAVLMGELDGQPLAFLPRHGRGHAIAPTEINFRANIDVLKHVGPSEVISVSAVGSLKFPWCAPMHPAWGRHPASRRGIGNPPCAWRHLPRNGRTSLFQPG